MQELAGQTSLAELARRLGRHPVTVCERARRIGISTRREWTYNSGYRVKRVGRQGERQRTRWEHIEVMERTLGRSIRKPECVHHINLVKADNRKENLHLCRNVAEHLRAHRSLEPVLPLLLERGIVMFDRAAGIYRLASEDRA